MELKLNFELILWAFFMIVCDMKMKYLLCFFGRCIPNMSWMLPFKKFWRRAFVVIVARDL